MLVALGATLSTVLCASVVDMLGGQTPGVTTDNVMGGQSSASAYVSTDQVMGGSSSGTVNVGEAVTFEGTVNTNGGGFAYVTLDGGTVMDISAELGIYLEFDSMSSSAYGAAPVAFQIELEGSQSCTLTGAFAVPTTALVERTHAWVPLLAFAPKGSHWSYSSWNTGIPSYCTPAATTSFSLVERFAIGNYYQHGPFKLVLYAVEARSVAPAEAVLASAAAPTVLASSVARANSLVSKAGAGVGAAQMDSMAAAVLATAAVQSSAPSLVAAAVASALASASARVAALLSAFGAFNVSAVGLGDNALSQSPPPPPSLTPANAVGEYIAIGGAVAAVLLVCVALAHMRQSRRHHQQGRLAPAQLSTPASRQLQSKRPAPSAAAELTSPKVLDVAPTPSVVEAGL